MSVLSECAFSPVCGNNACESGESCSSCPTDCGPCLEVQFSAVIAFSLTPATLTQGASVTASYTVTDNTALARAELWRAPYAAGSCDDSTKTGCSWGSAPVSEQAVSGKSYSGTLADTPPAGVFWYGLHAVDAAGNMGVASAPVKVVIIR